MKAKILYIINADWYFDLHWVERATFISEQGFNLHVATPLGDPLILSRLKSLGFSVHPIAIQRTSMSLFNEIKVLNNLRKIVEAVDPDLIHSVTIKPNLYSTILCRFLKIPLISTYAGLGTLGVSKDFKYRVSRSVIFNLLKVFSWSQKNVAFFENEEDLNLLCENKVIPFERSERVFGTGINLEHFSFSPVKRGEFNGLNVFFASRLLKNKGLSLLFNSVKELYDEGININLRIAGIFDFDSPFAYSVEEIEKMAAYPFVEWLGQRKDIKDLITESDVVCLPTTYGEGVPRILIEASAVGRPVIATPLGGCKDICINDFNGFLVEANSTKSITTALEKLAGDATLIDRFGRNGRKLVESKFSNQSVFEKHVNKYELMLNDKRQHR